MSEMAEDTEFTTEAATEQMSESESEPVTEQHAEAVTETEEAENKPKKEKVQEKKEETEAVTIRETEISTEEETEITETAPIDVKLAKEYSELVPEDRNPKEAGYPQMLKLAVTNPTKEDAELRLYFWDYDGAETDAGNIPKEILTECCKELLFPACGEISSYPAYLMSESGEEILETVWLKSDWLDDQMIAKYLDVTIPAGCMYIDSIMLLNYEAENVVVSPVVLSDDSVMDFDKCLFTWEEKVAEADVCQKVLLFYRQSPVSHPWSSYS